MNVSSEAAEQIVRMSLEGTEFAVKIAGQGAKEIGVFLVAAMQGARRTKGKTRLAGLLKSGKELKVFSLSENDLKKFSEEAKKYGVLYAALKGMKKSEDGMVDIMCRAEDASKVNRIFERFSLAAVDAAEIRRASLQSLEEQFSHVQENAEQLSDADQSQPSSEENSSPHITAPERHYAKNDNPTQARSAEKSDRSGRSSEEPNRSKNSSFPDTRHKPSVKQQLAEIKAGLADKTAEKEQSRTSQTVRKILSRANPAKHFKVKER